MAQTPPDDFLEFAVLPHPSNGTHARQVEVADELAALHRENDQLRRALTSRATIDQAKGILMAKHGGPPEEAFRRLVRMSQDTNVPLRDVASALVYHASNQY
jgi:AmiR/NasT family two-component response regulator